MKLIVLIFGFILATASTSVAQIELVPGDYFPADQEFQELQKVVSQETFENPTRLSKVDDGRLFSEVGFVKYARRVYAINNSNSLSVEIVTLLDYRAAYSLLSLLRNNNILDGPPGDYSASLPDGLCFAQGKQWVRIRGRNLPGELAKRVAVSISNRMGLRELKPPSLVSHLPKQGFDISSLRYYPGTKTFEYYSEKVGGTPLILDSDMEIAQARYSVEGRTGTLSLLNFPTQEMAEEYYDGLGDSPSVGTSGNKIFAKRAGPIVGILQGPFEPGAADKLLSSIKFRYSVQWVYEKGNKQKVLWGVPVGILTAVVKSLIFVVILGAASIIVGIVVAALRFKRRAKQSLDEKERNEITRLRMR